MDDMLESMKELMELLHVFTANESREISDIISDYEQIRDLINDIEEDEGYEQSSIAEVLEPAKSAIISTINNNMQRIVSNIYEDIRSELAKAKSLEDRIYAIAEGKELLDRLDQYPEHTNHEFLQKIINVIETYESQIDEAFQKKYVEQQEAELHRLMAGIEYTATDKQIKYLLALGAKPRQLHGITKEKASAMIARLKMTEE